MSEAAVLDPAENKLGSLMEEAKRLKVARDVLSKAFDEADRIFKAAKLDIIEELQNQGTIMTKVDGVGTASISTKLVPTTKDWTQVYEYVLENGMPELFQKRINLTAYKELRDGGYEIPGIEDFEVTDLNFRIIK